MKLNITHLAPYLPYGLKVQYEKYPNQLEVMGINQYSKRNYTLYLQGDWGDGNNGTSTGRLDLTNPLLLPMSSLYTEMEDGTVPIVELAKIHDKDFEDYIVIDSTSLVPDMGHVDYITHDGIECRFGFYNSFQAGYINPTKHSFVRNELDLFTYLFSHHFDVFSLIDNGLAIDKTKIK